MPSLPEDRPEAQSHAPTAASTSIEASTSSTANTHTNPSEQSTNTTESASVPLPRLQIPQPQEMASPHSPSQDGFISNFRQIVDAFVAGRSPSSVGSPSSELPDPIPAGSQASTSQAHIPTPQAPIPAPSASTPGPSNGNPGQPQAPPLLRRLTRRFTRTTPDGRSENLVVEMSVQSMPLVMRQPSARPQPTIRRSQDTHDLMAARAAQNGSALAASIARRRERISTLMREITANEALPPEERDTGRIARLNALRTAEISRLRADIGNAYRAGGVSPAQSDRAASAALPGFVHGIRMANNDAANGSQNTSNSSALEARTTEAAEGPGMAPAATEAPAHPLPPRPTFFRMEPRPVVAPNVPLANVPPTTHGGEGEVNDNELQAALNTLSNHWDMRLPGSNSITPPAALDWPHILEDWPVLRETPTGTPNMRMWRGQEAFPPNPNNAATGNPNLPNFVFPPSRPRSVPPPETRPTFPEHRHVAAHSPEYEDSISGISSTPRTRQVRPLPRPAGLGPMRMTRFQLPPNTMLFPPNTVLLPPTGQQLPPLPDGFSLLERLSRPPDVQPNAEPAAERAAGGAEEDEDDHGHGGGGGLPQLLRFITHAMTTGMQNLFTGVPPDWDRARVLLEALDVVSPGLLRRLDRVEDGGGGKCAVCWAYLRDPPDVDEPQPEEEEEDGAGCPVGPAAAAAAEKVPKCPIDGATVLSLPCTHTLHAACIFPWLGNHTTCPVCRFDLDPDSLTLRRSRPRTDTTAPHAPQNPPQGQPLPGVLLDNILENIFGLESPIDSPDTPGGTGEESPGPPTGGERSGNTWTTHRTHQIMPGMWLTIETIRHSAPDPARPSGAAPAQAPTPPSNSASGATDDNGAMPTTANAESAQTAPSARSANAGNQGLGPAPFPILPNAPISTIFLAGFDDLRHPMAPQQNTASTDVPTSRAPTPSRPLKRKYTAPSGSQTLRERIEAMEEKAGLRCSAPSCVYGPTDEDAPNATSFSQPTKYGVHNDQCPHKFHATCLVTACRIQGHSGSVGAVDGEVAVTCPICRTEHGSGWVHEAVWEEGEVEAHV